MFLKQEQRDEIQDLTTESSITKRATVRELEEILYQPLQVLDHGFVRVIDYMGDDSAIVQSARVSYGRGTKKVSEDKGLINYLMRHWHTTPFEMCEIKFHVKLPIFIARQWIRHRTANVNEYSARYSIMDNEFYIPAPENLAAQSNANRQGRGEVLTGAEAHHILNLLKQDSELCYKHYREMLNLDLNSDKVIDPSKQGLTRELARMNLTLNCYTQWYWKIDLHNFMHFLRLRADPHAQYEIRAYCDIMLTIMQKWVPFAYEAFMDHRLNSVTLSEKAFGVVKERLAGKTVTQESSGLSKREWNELMAHLENNSADQNQKD